MIRIAVCDDEVAEIKHNVELINEYFKKSEIQLFEFTSASDILEYEDGSFDIVLMDIEMPAPDGFEVAKRLNKWNHPPIVILVTNSRLHTLQGYRVATRYLQKPVDKDELFEALNNAKRVLTKNKAIFTINSEAVKVDVRDIIYVERYGHYAIIHATNRVYKIRDKLEDIIYKLAYDGFAFPHKSYFVNMDYIRAMSSKNLSLLNGDVIPISKSRQKEFTALFYKYYGEVK